MTLNVSQIFLTKSEPERNNCLIFEKLYNVAQYVLIDFDLFKLFIEKLRQIKTLKT